MLIFLYRVRGGQVLGISTSAGPYAGVDPAYFTTLTDPATPDGVDLAVPKIRDGATVRNATAGEIAQFPVDEATDNNLMSRARAEATVDGATDEGKRLRALALLMLDEFNNLRQWLTSFKAEVAAASNLADFKARVATLPNMPDRTAAQLKTAIKSKISSGNAD